MDPPPDDSLLAVLSAALDQSRSAACITTAELDPPGPQIVYVNPAYCAMTGRSATEVVGRTPRIMQGPLTDRAVLDRLRADLTAGRAFTGETVNYRKDGQPFLISWRIDPVVAADGTTTHYIATQEDITRIRRAERLLAAEQAIDRSVSTILSRPADAEADLGALAADIVAAVDELVDYGLVTIAGSIKLGTSRVAFGAGEGPAVETELTDRLGPGAGEVVTGALDGRRWLGCSVTSHRTGIEGGLFVTGLDDDQLEFIDRAGVARAAECARRALDSVGEYERQRLAAVELQRNLLPSTIPDVPGIELAARYQPGAFAARVGGDWYDVVHDGERVVLVVGDMAGSGLRAAADMGRVRLLSRVLLQRGATVPELLAELDRFCSDEDLIATLLAVTVDLGDRSAQLCSAGHLPPIITEPGTARLAAVRPAPLLGLGRTESDYHPQPLSIGPDTVVVMFTDGMVENPDEPIDRSLARLVDEAADAPDVESLCNRLIGRRLAERPADDIALLAFRLGRPSTPQRIQTRSDLRPAPGAGVS